MQDNQFAKSRDRRKRRRVVIQAVIIVLALIGLVYTTANLPGFSPEIAAKPEPTPQPSRVAAAIAAADLAAATGVQPEVPFVVQPPSGATQREQGFVALSYVGVGPREGQTVISDVRLEKHLNALKARGFVTISQQNILDYFFAGKALPENALFIFFEDGRMQSARLAHPMLKRLGYRATILSYANNLEAREPLFLSAEELKELERTGVWEVGTNGYRISYINVFDRHHNFLGEITPHEYFFLSRYLRRDYNHYLMDFIRDEFDTPIESLEQMKARIETDYKLMDTVYQNRLGALPGMYVLMHSNTNQFATNPTVSIENEKWIRQYFKMNFNREMLSINKPDADIYDLTRMQPQSYWSVNHLLMRIYDDMGKLGVLPFEQGDTQRAAQWTLLSGAAEWDGNTIRLTSLPEGEGRLMLKGSESLTDFDLDVRLDGNKMGRQTIELHAPGEDKPYTAISVNLNNLIVYNKSISSTEPNITFELDLTTLDKTPRQTWEENRQEAMAAEIERKQAQTYLPAESKEIAEKLTRAKANTANANNAPFIPEVSLMDDGSWALHIAVRNGQVTITVNGTTVLSNHPISTALGGGVMLRSAWLEYGYSQRNLADDVYDGDFANLFITSPQGGTVLDYRGADEAPKDTDPGAEPEQAPQPVMTPVPEAKPFYQPVFDWFRRLFR